MAPEEILDARLADIRADIYSLGCTLYRFLTGRVPFPAPNPITKARCHLEKEPESLARLRPDAPPDLARTVERMMAKAPADRPQTPAEAARALTRFAGGVRPRILLVDDEAVSRGALAIALEGEGYEVSGAANGLEALERLRGQGPWDLIVLDMMMPQMDGWQFLQAMRSEPGLADIPVVVLSGAKIPQARALALGVADYLQKPLPVEELATRIGRHAGFPAPAAGASQLRIRPGAG